MNRRGILQSSACGLSLILSRERPSLAAALNATTPRAIVYDERYAGARAFAAYLRPRVAALYPTRGDATGFWYGALGTLLREHGGAVAGLTTYPDLVLARSRGRELGLRLVFERNEFRGFDRIAPTGGMISQCDWFISALRERPPFDTENSRAGELTAWLLEPRT